MEVLASGQPAHALLIGLRRASNQTTPSRIVRSAESVETVSLTRASQRGSGPAWLVTAAAAIMRMCPQGRSCARAGKFDFKQISALFSTQLTACAHSSLSPQSARFPPHCQSPPRVRQRDSRGRVRVELTSAPGKRRTPPTSTFGRVGLEMRWEPRTGKFDATSYTSRRPLR
jgi:hypothetical protein